MLRVTHRALLAVVGGCAVVAVVGLLALWPYGGTPERVEQSVQRTELLDATLLQIREVEGETTSGLNPEETVIEVEARIDDSGEQVTFQTSDSTGGTFAVGQRVRLARVSGDQGAGGSEGVTYYIADFRRGGALAVLVALFLTAVIGFGRWQGVRALAGLVVTFGIILGFIIPAILADRPPLLVALVGSLAVMLITLYLSHGVSRKTSAAVVGTALALLLTGLLALVFVRLASFTGFTSEEAQLANFEVGGLSLQGLILAGIVIGGLGVLDDVTVSQASTVFELHRADRRAGFATLVRSALTVGRDHIAATVNTLFLAYAGAALPLLILFSLGDDSFTTVATSEIVAVEIVRTLVGSLGLIAAVPLTTALAAGVALTESDAATDEAGRPAPGATASGAGRSAAPVAAASAEDEEDAEWVARLRESYRLPPKNRREDRP